MSFRRENWRTILLSVAVAICAVLFSGCASLQVVRAPGAYGKIVDAETGKPVWQATITRRAAPYEVTSTNGTNVVVHTVTPRQTWTASAYSSRNGTFTLHPAVTFDPEVLIPFVHVNRRNTVSGNFVIEAKGYAPFSGSDSASEDQRWRVDFKIVKLHRPENAHSPEDTHKP